MSVKSSCRCALCFAVVLSGALTLCSSSQVDRRQVTLTLEEADQMPVATARRSGHLGPPAPRGWVRDFRLLMVGSFVSMLGSRVSTIACPLLALFLTNSPFDAGLVAFAATVPSVLVYIPAGALVDRWDPRRTMLVCESGRGVTIAIIAVSLAISRPSIVLLIPVVIAEEILEVFSTLADRRCVRDLVPSDQASSAQASIETRAHVVVLAGRPLGVFLFSVGSILPFLADALSFIVSVSSIVSLKAKRIVAPRPTRISRQRLHDDIFAARDWLLKDKYARAALPLSAGATLIGQALIMVFLAWARTSSASSAWMGLVLAASGIGGVLGALAAPRFRMPFPISLVLLQMLAWAVALMLLAIWGSLGAWGPWSFPCMAIVMAVQSLTGALANIEIDTYLVRSCDENMLARVTSFGRLMAFSASAVGPLLGGVLFEFYGARNAVFGLVAIMWILALLACFTPSMWNRPVVETPAAPQLTGPWATVTGLCGTTVSGVRSIGVVFVHAARGLRAATVHAVGSVHPATTVLLGTTAGLSDTMINGARSAWSYWPAVRRWPHVLTRVSSAIIAKAAPSARRSLTAAQPPAFPAQSVNISIARISAADGRSLILVGHQDGEVPMRDPGTGRIAGAFAGKPEAINLPQWNTLPERAVFVLNVARQLASSTTPVESAADDLHPAPPKLSSGGRLTNMAAAPLVAPCRASLPQRRGLAAAQVTKFCAVRAESWASRMITASRDRCGRR